jgi:hypothetical protein
MRKVESGGVPYKMSEGDMHELKKQAIYDLSNSKNEALAECKLLTNIYQSFIMSFIIYDS